MTTTKQPQQEQGEVKDMEPITSELLQKRYKLLDDYLSKLSDSNIKNGLDPSKAGEYVAPIYLVTRNKLQAFFKDTIHPQTGNFFTRQNIEAMGNIIEDNEGVESPPSFKLTRLSRVLTPTGKQYLVRHLMAFLYDDQGNIKNQMVSNLDYYNKPQLQYLAIPADSNDKDGRKIRIAKIAHQNTGLEPIGPREYLVPYSASTVSAILKQTPPIGPFSDKDRGCGLAWIKLGETMPAISMNSIDEFLSGDFEATFAAKRAPRPTININSKELLTSHMIGETSRQYA